MEEIQYFGQRRIEIAVLRSSFGKLRERLDRLKSDGPCLGGENSQGGTPDAPSASSAPPQPSFVPVASPPGIEPSAPSPRPGDSAPGEKEAIAAPEGLLSDSGPRSAAHEPPSVVQASAQGMAAAPAPDIAGPSQASSPPKTPEHDRVTPATAGGSLAEARRATIQELIKTLQVLKPGAPIEARRPPSTSAPSNQSRAGAFEMKTFGTLPELKQLEVSAQMASRAARSNARIRVQTCPDLPGIQEEANPAVQALPAGAAGNAGYAERPGGYGGVFEANTAGWSTT